MGNVARIVILVLVGVGGWALGSIFPMPQSVVERINPQLIQERVRSLGGRAVSAAVAAGQLIEIERVDMSESADAPDLAMGGNFEAPAMPSNETPVAFETTLSICPGMSVTNSPPTDASRNVNNYAAIVDVNSVRLAVNPTHGACLSSGFGPRGERVHKGVDYHSDTGGPILAGADGTIIEMKYRDDFGNMLLIDHGHGVYTRYAHLSSFRNGLAVGSQVSAGELIGLMGNTAGFPLPIHLHYEVLTGDYNNPSGSFGLEAENPFSYPPA